MGLPEIEGCRAPTPVPGSQRPATPFTQESELDDLVYRISHDLRASVRALQHLPVWIAEDLESDGIELPESPRKSLSFIASHARRLDHMLNGLLDYARVGRLQASSEQEPRRVLDDVIEDLGPPSGVTIENAIAPGGITMGETDLARIFVVLLSNAIRHNPARPSLIRVEGHENGGTWEFAVIDDGPGIPSQHRDAVFRPMVKLVSRDREEGAGMGLAVLAKIAAQADGRVWIEDGPDGRGTAVRVRLGA